MSELEGSGGAEALQATNWRSAQALSLRIDPLVPKALRLLRFLQQVDRHRCLYQGPAVSRAIRRYEQCWLPLLSEHQTAGSSCNSFTSLEPPLDCAWIWHCHRLNPIAYARDCRHLYGRVLGVPSTMDSSEGPEISQRLWEERFPQEKYHVDLSSCKILDSRQPSASTPYQKLKSRIGYNLEEAVMRQTTFYYQVSQPHMKEESFLRGAEQRYKGFLHLFRLTNCNFFLVPTYDIDLMWHVHQLHPEAYSEDLNAILGKVLEHDDTDSDGNLGQKLQHTFNKTCQHWQECYGAVYRRAGSMYRGEPPACIPLFTAASASSEDTNTVVGMPLDSVGVGVPLDPPLLPPREVMQVFLTIRRARNMPVKRGSFRIRLRMEEKCRSFKLETPSIPFSSEIVWDHLWRFEVEKSTLGFWLELLRKHAAELKQKMVGSEVLGEAYISWQQLLDNPSLSFDGWVSMQHMRSSIQNSPSLSVSVSLTPPLPAPFLCRIIKCIPTDDSCHMIVGSAKRGHGCWLTKTVLDHTNKVVFIIRTSYSDGRKPARENEKCLFIHQGEWEYPNSYTNVGTAPDRTVAIARQIIMDQDTPEILSMQRHWGLFENTSLLTVSRVMADPKWNVRPSLQIQGNLSNQIRLICGRKLDYEVKGAGPDSEAGFVTLIRYDPMDAPLGKATALFNWRTGAMEVSPNESVVLVLLLLSVISTAVYDMEGLKINLHIAFHGSPIRQATSLSDEWGAVVLSRKLGLLASKSEAMMPYYCWWDMPPKTWATFFYSPSNHLLQGSKCGAAGACGGACGGSACHGAGCQEPLVFSV